MKILYHHRIASKDGQYVHVEELINALKMQGHEVIIVGPRAAEKSEFGSGAGFVAYLKRYVPSALYEMLEFAYSLCAFAKLFHAVVQYRPDFLYERYNLYLPSGVWLKKLFRLPMLLEVNAPLFEERSQYNSIALPWLARWSQRYTWQEADYVLPVTEVLAGYVRQARGPAKNIVVVHNGANLDHFHADCSYENTKAQLGLNGKLVLGFVGFMREWHGLEKLVPYLSWEGWHDVHLLLVGDGPARHAIESLASKLGETHRVTITGVMPRSQIPDYIAAFDIALQPDVVEYASPLKVFEYMAMGKAIVAPATNNIREILTSGVDSLLFDDEQGLIESITHFLADEQLRFKCARGAKQTLIDRQFTWNDNARKIVAIGGTLCSQQVWWNK